MARRRAPQRPARGGGGIPALRQARPRLIAAALSTLAYAGVLAYAVARTAVLPVVGGALGGIGALMLLLVLARGIEELLAWALVCLGLAYALSLVHRGPGVDEGVPLVAAGLLLCTELAAWSLDERQAVAAERAVVAARALGLALLAAAGLAASAIVVALTAAPAGGGLAWTVLGALAAVVAVGTAARLARRQSAD